MAKQGYSEVHNEIGIHFHGEHRVIFVDFIIPALALAIINLVLMASESRRYRARAKAQPDIEKNKAESCQGV